MYLVNGFSLINTQLQSSSISGRQFTILTRRTSRIFQTRLNSPCILRTSSVITIALSSRVVRFHYHIRRSWHASERISHISFGTPKEGLSIFNIRYILRVRQDGSMTNRFSQIRPRTRKMTFLSPSIRTARIQGNLGPFLRYRFNGFARFRRQTFTTSSASLRSQNDVNVHFQCHQQITITQRMALNAQGFITRIINHHFRISERFGLCHSATASLATSATRQAGTKGAISVLFRQLHGLIRSCFNVNSQVNCISQGSQIIRAQGLASPWRLVASRPRRRGSSHRRNQRCQSLCTCFKGVHRITSLLRIVGQRFRSHPGLRRTKDGRHVACTRPFRCLSLTFHTRSWSGFNEFNRTVLVRMSSILSRFQSRYLTKSHRYIFCIATNGFSEYVTSQRSQLIPIQVNYARFRQTNYLISLTFCYVGNHFMILRRTSKHIRSRCSQHAILSINEMTFEGKRLSFRKECFYRLNSGYQKKNVNSFTSVAGTSGPIRQHPRLNLNGVNFCRFSIHRRLFVFNDRLFVDLLASHILFRGHVLTMRTVLNWERLHFRLLRFHLWQFIVSLNGRIANFRVHAFHGVSNRSLTQQFRQRICLLVQSHATNCGNLINGKLVFRRFHIGIRGLFPGLTSN